MGTTEARQTRTTIEELRLVFWGASWLSLFISSGFVLIGWFDWLSVDICYYLGWSLVLSPILRSLSEAAGQIIDHKNRNAMAERLKRYVSAANAPEEELTRRIQEKLTEAPPSVFGLQFFKPLVTISRTSPLGATLRRE